MYTAAVGPALEAAGYARVHTVFVLTIPHYTVYAMPEIAARVAQRAAGRPDAR